jgi:hypothetical protein
MVLVWLVWLIIVNPFNIFYYTILLIQSCIILYTEDVEKNDEKNSKKEKKKGSKFYFRSLNIGGYNSIISL